MEHSGHSDNGGIQAATALKLSVTTERVRIRITSSRLEPTLAEFGLFKQAKLKQAELRQSPEMPTAISSSFVGSTFTPRSLLAGLPSLVFRMANVKIGHSHICQLFLEYLHSFLPLGDLHALARCRPDRQRDERGAALSAAGRFRRQGPHRLDGGVREALSRRRPTTWRAFGATWPANCTGSSRSRRCSSGTSRSPKWFVGGKTNASYNCLDIHLKTHRRDKPALIWEGEPGDTRVLTYQSCTTRSAASPTC